MILEIILNIAGIILLFLPGVLLSYIIFPKTDIIKRAGFSIVLGVSIAIITSVLLFILNLFNVINVFLSLIFLSILFLLIMLNSDKEHETDFNKDIFYLIFFSLIGALWRIRFLSFASIFSDAYGYAGKFIGKEVPDLGFYTGMAVDHSNYAGTEIIKSIFTFISTNNYLSIFLITFVYLVFIYLIFCEFRDRKLAIVGVGLMSLGPIEIFHSTLLLIGPSLAYVNLFSLFLLFKLEDNKVFWISLLLSVSAIFTYYTSSMVMLLASVGFSVSLLIKELIKTKNIKKTFKNSLKNRKLFCFLLITLILFIHIYFLSDMIRFTKGTTKDFSNLPKVISSLKAESTVYKDPTFLGLSAIRWQMLFFFLCGLTFIFHLIRKKDFSEENLGLILCLIPISIVSYGFLHVNLPTRIFDYFAFFGLLSLKIPKRWLKIFFILSFVFLFTTGVYVMKDKKIFFENSDGEIKAASWIKENLNETVFSDQKFINLVILKDYYNVTGTYDEDPLIKNLFYNNNLSTFLSSVKELNSNLSVDYIAITKRMQEKYVLMLNYPQKQIQTTEFFEENLEKVYGNGDVKIYKTKI